MLVDDWDIKEAKYIVHLLERLKIISVDVADEVWDDLSRLEEEM